MDLATADDLEAITAQLDRIETTLADMGSMLATLVANHNAPAEPPLLMKRTELIAHGGTSGESIDQLIEDGVLHWYVVGTSRRLSRLEFEEHLATLRSPASPTEAQRLRAV